MAIPDWPADQRPREKLLAQGAAVLSDAELLAIFLRVGIPGLSAVDLAEQLIQRFGGLRPLLNASQADFERAKGLGPAKYAQLQAVLELARRHLAEALPERNLLNDPALVRQHLSALLRDEPSEVFYGLFLDSQHQLIAEEVIARGTLATAAVYPREVVKRVLALNAAGLIVAHNHPSGVAEPSEADRVLTQKLKAALASIDVRLLDHFVVGEGRPISLAERGWV